MSGIWSMDGQHSALTSAVHDCIMSHHDRPHCSGGGVGGGAGAPRYSFSISDFHSLSSSASSKPLSKSDSRCFTIGTSPCSSSSFLSKMDSSSNSSSGATSPTTSEPSGPVRFFIGPPPSGTF